MVDKQEFIKLVKKFLEGKATTEEADILHAFYDGKHSGDSMKSLMNDGEIEALGAEIFGQIKAGIGRAPVKRMDRRAKYGMIAASVLIAVLCGFLVRYIAGRNTGAGDGFEAVNAGSGEVKKVVLRDGTTVWLNAKSKLRYREREAYLEGEAFFDVKTDASHPFLVHTGALTTHVLGTKFNVNAYQTAKVEVVLLEGRVMLTTPASVSDTVFLAPNEKAVFSMNRSLEKVQTTAAVPDRPAAGKDTGRRAGPRLMKQADPNALAAAAWHDGELVFDGEPLENVLDALDKKLNVSIKASPELSQYPITLKVDGESIDDILIAITEQIKKGSYSAQFRKSGNDYYIE